MYNNLAKLAEILNALSCMYQIIIPHGPPENPMPMDPFFPLHFMLGLHMKPHMEELPEPFGIHGHAPPHDDDEQSEQKLPPYHPDGPPKGPKMGNSKQSAQVINNYFIFAKELKKLFDVKNGALPWSPPAESIKREMFEHGKESKLPEGLLPQQPPNLPGTATPVIEDKEESSKEPQPLVVKTTLTPDIVR
ncbi:unnamed protein product [Cylicostephanus goldi]|uniref:Uncharacterized protein n=1 Tax=Cylicostephanus goldi TaxID=71465 RepID=A0A3P7QGY1_CYLGO|nr:unnamed protein product [Cylicostephanus goldi]